MMARTKILIIDDEEHFAKLVKMNLEKTGRYEVRQENKGANGLEAAKEFKPDLILLDILMQDTEGGEVAAQLKDDAVTKDIPLVFLTAVVKKEEVGEGCSIIGGHPFVAKPVSTGDLINCIERNLAK